MGFETKSPLKQYSRPLKFKVLSAKYPNERILAPAESFGLPSRLFWPSGKKKAFLAVCDNLRSLLMSSSNLVTVSSNLRP